MAHSVKWLKAKGHEFRDAVDGRDGVNIYESEGPFEYVTLPFTALLFLLEVSSIVLLDLSMPKLDGSYTFALGISCEVDIINRHRSHNGDPTDRIGPP
jgi:hypothetical protein